MSRRREEPESGELPDGARRVPWFPLAWGGVRGVVGCVPAGPTKEWDLALSRQLRTSCLWANTGPVTVQLRRGVLRSASQAASLVLYFRVAGFDNRTLRRVCLCALSGRCYTKRRCEDSGWLGRGRHEGQVDCGPWVACLRGRWMSTELSVTVATNGAGSVELRAGRQVGQSLAVCSRTSQFVVVGSGGLRWPWI